MLAYLEWHFQNEFFFSVGHQPEWALVQRHVSEDIFGIQLCGCQPHQFGRVAQLVEDGHIDVDFVDL